VIGDRRFFGSCEAKETADSREAVVPCADPVSTVSFEVVEEVAHRGDVDILHLSKAELAGWSLMA